MKSIVKKVLLEPLFHFFVLACITYLYFQYTVKHQADKKTTIIISQDISKGYLKGTNPTLIDALVKQKFFRAVLLHEAYSLGLDKQKDIDEETMVAKMKLILFNTINFNEPTQEELYAYYQKNIISYSNRENISFIHIFFKELDKESKKDIFELLKYSKVHNESCVYFGDTAGGELFFKEKSFKDIKKIFGNYFAQKVYRYKEGLWQKALRSKYGYHFVKIVNTNTSWAYEFDDVLERVYDDYTRELREKNFRVTYEKLASKYKLEIEDDN